MRNIGKVEDILIKSGLFNVEGKKKARELDSDIEVLVVDFTAELPLRRRRKSL